MARLGYDAVRRAGRRLGRDDQRAPRRDRSRAHGRAALEHAARVPGGREQHRAQRTGDTPTSPTSAEFMTTRRRVPGDPGQEPADARLRPHRFTGRARGLDRREVLRTGPTTTATLKTRSRATRSSRTSPCTGSRRRSTRRSACTASRSGARTSDRSDDYRRGADGRGRVSQGDVPDPRGVRRVPVQSGSLHPLRPRRPLRRARGARPVGARRQGVLRRAGVTNARSRDQGRNGRRRHRRAPPHGRRRDHRRRRHRGRHASTARARETVDADGALVTPGFVDVHTHFDGQVTWDPLLTPTCWHGVTTIVMGNCGVGFAPVQARPARLADRPDGRRRGHPRRRAVAKASSGAGSTSPSTSTRSTACRRCSTSARRCRTARCART